MPTIIRRYTRIAADPPCQGDLRAVASARTERFGIVYYGETPARDAAGVWGERLPQARVQVELKLIGAFILHNTRAPLQVAGLDGWVFARSHRRLYDRLFHFWTRSDRAIHVELPDRRYTYRLRRMWGAQVIRHWYGAILIEHVLSRRVLDHADDIDAAVALLLSGAVGRRSMVRFTPM